jgi:hypothetical protein
VIEHFEKPVDERTPEEMCVHAKAILDVLVEIPPEELSDGDIAVGQLAENLRQLIHAVPLEQIERHRSDSPVDRRVWGTSR